MNSSMPKGVFIIVGVVVLLSGCVIASPNPEQEAAVPTTLPAQTPDSVEPTTLPTESEAADIDYDVTYEQVECRFSDF